MSELLYSIEEIISSVLADKIMISMIPVFNQDIRRTTSHLHMALLTVSYVRYTDTVRQIHVHAKVLVYEHGKCQLLRSQTQAMSPTLITALECEIHLCTLIPQLYTFFPQTFMVMVYRMRKVVILFPTQTCLGSTKDAHTAVLIGGRLCDTIVTASAHHFPRLPRSDTLPSFSKQ